MLFFENADNEESGKQLQEGQRGEDICGHKVSKVQI